MAFNQKLAGVQRCRKVPSISRRKVDQNQLKTVTDIRSSQQGH